MDLRNEMEWMDIVFKLMDKINGTKFSLFGFGNVLVCWWCFRFLEFLCT